MDLGRPYGREVNDLVNAKNAWATSVDSGLHEFTACGNSRPISLAISSDSHFMQKLDDLMQKHKADLSSCLDTWLRSKQPDFAQTTSINLAKRSLPKIDVQELKESSEDIAELNPTGTHVEHPNALIDLPPPDAHLDSPRHESSAGQVFNSVVVTPHSLDHTLQKFDDKSSDGKEEQPKKKKYKKVSEILLEHTRGVVKSQQNVLQRVTEHQYYEFLSASLIIVNAVFIGWQTQHMALQARKASLDSSVSSITFADVASSIVTAMIFSVLFAIDLCLRWAADGFLYFFQTHDVYWNILDIVVVVFALVDCLLEVVESQTGVTHNIALLRVLRIVRVVRIARIVRVMRFFKVLRVMVFSIMGSMKSLLWVLLVLGIMFYMFGIAFTAAVVAHLQQAHAGSVLIDVDLVQHFGTLDLSFVSLFMAMSGGNDWGQYYDALQPLGFAYRGLFLLYISFSVIAIFNIVTGVFVDSALKSNQTDREILIQDQIQNQKDYLEEMTTIFDEIDVDGTGYVSKTEFERSLEDERVVAYFTALKLDVSDARTLFLLLDHDHSEEVNIKEFIAGCYKLQGESRSLDVNIMQYQVRFLAEMVVKVHDILKLPEKANDLS